MLSVEMFIIGAVIFVLYVAGLIYMINWGHNSQKRKLENDPEIKK
tara:strand:- start:368 stop:502 length:135 start_codon:yes stop_codon:yes gene_type:complete